MQDVVLRSTQGIFEDCRGKYMGLKTLMERLPTRPLEEDEFMYVKLVM